MRLHILVLLLLGISLTINAASIKWSFATGGIIDSTPGRAFGLIYSGSADGNLYAVDENTGSLAWKFSTQGPIYGSSPAFRGNAVFIGSTDGSLYAVDANTGKEKWTFKTNGPIWGSSPSVKGNVLYIGSTDGNLYAINADTGEELWNFSTKGKIYDTPFVSNLLVFFGSTDGNVYALDSLTGRVEWTAQTGSSIWTSSPFVDTRETVYIGAIDGNLYALDSRTGAIKWKFSTNGWILSNPVVVNDVVYFGSNDKNVYAIDTNGNLIWTFKTDGEIEGSFTYTITPGGTRILYFGSNDNHVYGISENGTLIWKKQLGSWVHSTPVLAENRLFVGSYDDNLYALSTLSCTFVTPENASEVYDSASITGSSFADNGVASVKVKVGDDGTFEDVAGSVDNWVYELVATNIKPGAFNVYCKATDITGQEEVEPYENLMLFKASGVRNMSIIAATAVGVDQEFKVYVTYQNRPLDNVKVIVEGNEYMTDSNGSVSLKFQRNGQERINFFKGGFQDAVVVVSVGQDNTVLYIVIGIVLIVGIATIIILGMRLIKR